MCRVSYGFESFGSAYPDAFNGAVPAEIMGAVLSSIAQKIKNCNDRSGWKENVVDNSLIYLFNLHYVSRMFPNLSRLPLSKIRLSDFTNTATIYPPNVSSDIYFLYIFIYSSFGFTTLCSLRFLLCSYQWPMCKTSNQKDFLNLGFTILCDQNVTWPKPSNQDWRRDENSAKKTKRTSLWGWGVEGEGEGGGVALWPLMPVHVHQ